MYRTQGLNLNLPVHQNLPSPVLTLPWISKHLIVCHLSSVISDLMVYLWYSLQLLDLLMLWHLQHIDQFFLICSSANMRLVCEDSWTHRLLLFFRQRFFLTLQIHTWRTGVNPGLYYPICVLFLFFLYSTSGVSYRFTFNLRRLILVMWPPSVDHWTTSATDQVSMLMNSLNFSHRLEICNVMIQIGFKACNAWARLLDDITAPSCGYILISSFAKHI